MYNKKIEGIKTLSHCVEILKTHRGISAKEALEVIHKSKLSDIIIELYDVYDADAEEEVYAGMMSYLKSRGIQVPGYETNKNLDIEAQIRKCISEDEKHLGQ